MTCVATGKAPSRQASSETWLASREGEGGASGEERGNKGTSDKTGRDETKRKGKETEKGGAGVKGRLRC